MKKPHPVRARLYSFKYAFQGIKTLLRTQANARIHLIFTVLVIGAGFFFEVSISEWTVLCLAMGGVWMAEAFNTALEFLVDLVSPDHHELAGKAKDVSAAAVLLMAIFAATAGLIIFIPKGWAWIQPFL